MFILNNYLIIERLIQMKIAVPSDGRTLESNICISFGRCEQFLIVDSESMDFSILDNSAVAEMGGAGIKAAQSIVDNSCETLITMHLGENAADVLKPADVKMIRGKSGTVKENIELYNKGKLSELTEIHKGYHMGHSAN